MTDLKPCPFCGSEAAAECADAMWVIRCIHCPASMAFFMTYENAAKCWNRRMVRCSMTRR